MYVFLPRQLIFAHYSLMLVNDLRWKQSISKYGRNGMVRLKFTGSLEKRSLMRLKLGVVSLVLFLLSVLFLILMTLFEFRLTRFSLTGERILSLFLLVVPAVMGVVCGLLSIARKSPRPG